MVLDCYEKFNEVLELLYSVVCGAKIISSSSSIIMTCAVV